MKTITLLLGGARSGKSYFAQEAAKKAEKVLFVATAQAGDEDMLRRIQKHQAERPANWRTVEATTHIGRCIEETIRTENLVIIDCITLLVTNIICQIDEKEYDSCDEAALESCVLAEIKELQECLKNVNASFILVSNEVGSGIVPDNRISRIYRDLLGRANQMLAQSADEVYLMVAGIPLRVKPRSA
ncbi:MAG TPA: bifunctional adenosylcobinamide kinase/adenosylcobinamide-phosphate guanylyltransferase [Dehalococcoidales bacterium]|nr:bifunctional adenosylcobinamide kinase/adenosylcobinamide-phosphate guanylyltransferase [Dehalococcoidales bacterium]